MIVYFDQVISEQKQTLMHREIEVSDLKRTVADLQAKLGDSSSSAAQTMDQLRVRLHFLACGCTQTQTFLFRFVAIARLIIHIFFHTSAPDSPV